MSELHDNVSAKLKQLASRVSGRKADQATEPDMKEKPPMYDPLDDMSPEDRKWAEQTAIAKARQEAAHSGPVRPMTDKEHDAAREATEIAQRKMAMAHGVRPADLVNVQLPGGQVAQVVESGLLSFWVNIVGEAPEMFASDWKGLKAKLKGLTGTHLIRNYKFSATAENVLGFFRPKDDHPFPVVKPAEEFHVLVQGDMVFRADSE